MPAPPLPTPPAEDEAVAPIVRRNVSALAEMRAAEDRRLTPLDRFVESVTRFAGGMSCVALHVTLCGGWMIVNLGWFRRLPVFDPPPFELLVALVGIEAIFLAMFILNTQNRARTLAERRADLHLQIALLTEHELTRTIHLLDAVATRLDVRHGDDLADVKRDVHPENVVDEIVRAEGADGKLQSVE